VEQFSHLICIDTLHLALFSTDFMTSRKRRKKDDLYFNKFYISPSLILIVEEVIE
jgi:hypothetical protein